MSAEASSKGITPGHPRGLYTLFFTEMWERFSYYGMRALLVLFMTDAVVEGGLGMTETVATSIYGLYTAAVYLAALPGGWMADRFFGAQRAVWYGGILIAAGQFMLVVPRSETFYAGLVLVALGTGLLKPNVSAMVGELYPQGGARRDAGFSIFYVGINLGAFLGPLASGYLRKEYNWRLGFAAAGAGMVLGLLQYRLFRKNLGDAGMRPGHVGGIRRKDWVLLGVLGGGSLGLIGLTMSGALRFDPVALVQGIVYVIGGLAAAYFGVAFLFFGLDASEKRRVVLIAILFVASVMFWTGLEQAGSSLNLFAARYTQRVLLAYEVPAEWFQAFGPVFVVTLAPVVAALWVTLSRRNLDPPLPVKFALGLLLLGLGFLVMAGASRSLAAGHKVWPTWLIITYLFHTFGELCLSPVGLSWVTKLAPKRLVGQMMGVWFLATSLGNLLAGLVAGKFGGGAVDQMAARYLLLVLVTCGTGLLLLLFTRPIRRLAAGVD